MTRTAPVVLSEEQIAQNLLREELEYLLYTKYRGLSNYTKAAILEIEVLAMNEVGG